MASQLLIDRIEDVKRQAAFERRHGVNVTDEQALAGHLAEALAELEGLRDERGFVVDDCGLTSTKRRNGDSCADKCDGDDCAACQVFAAESLMFCGLSEKERRAGAACAAGRDDDCGECRLFRAKLREDCGLRYEEYSKGAACKAYDGDAEYPNCGACRVRNAEHDLRLEIEAERNDAARVDGADLDRRDAEIARVRDLLDCGVERDEASVCKFRDVSGKAICAECFAHSVTRSLDRASMELVAVTNERDVLRAERNRLILELDAPKPKAEPPKPRAKDGQGAFAFDAAPAAPTVAKARPCGCATRGAHRKACAEYKAPVRKAGPVVLQ